MKFLVPDRVRERYANGHYCPIGEPSECWPGSGAIGNHGYGVVGWQEGDKARTLTLHRLAWITVHGSIPSDMTVDHLCFNRACANPSHLQLLTLSANSGRTPETAAGICRQALHPWPASRHVSPGGVPYCRPCSNASWRRWDSRRMSR